MAESGAKYEEHTDSGSVNIQFPSDKSKMVSGGSSNGSDRSLLVVIAIVAVVAIIALVIAIVGFTKPPKMTVNVGNGDSNTGSGSQVQPSTGDSQRTNTGGQDDDKTWVFAIGHDGTSLEYIHDDGGLRGFHVDIVNAVCDLANKDCRFMFDVYGRCWDSEAGQLPRIGVGLADGWYDACTGWFATYERLRTVTFTHAFRKPFSATFFVQAGNPNGFDWQNLTGKKIGIADGWAADEYCIKRNSDKITGAELSSDQMIHYPNVESLDQAVLDGTVDAGFGNVNIFSGSALESIGQEITNCMKDGGAMMSRKDNRLSDWWNPAFERLKDSSRYREICNKAMEDHGHMPGEILCVD